MKTFNKIITLCAICLLASTSINAGNKSPNPEKIRIWKKYPQTHNKPRMPSNQCLEFYYFSDTQECQFTFNYDIESLSVTIVEISTGAIYTGEVSQESPVMYQALPSGDYHITCITDEGDTYEGEGNIQ